MSLTIVCGRAGSGKSRHCLDSIRDALRREPDGAPLVLLLPEQSTFQMERELAKTPGLGGFVRAYVLGFRRLAHRVLAETGGALRPQITDLGKRLIISRLLAEYQDDLALFTGATGRRSFADTVAGLIQEFKNYNITPQELFAAQKAAGETALAQKLGDLALVYQGFEAYLAASGLASEDYLSLLAAKIPHSAIFRDAQVWVDGFHWFTPAEYAVLEQVLRCAKDVTVTLCLPEPEADRHGRETALFYRQYQTLLKLKHMAKSCGCEVRQFTLEECRRLAARPVLLRIESAYAGLPAGKLPETAEGLEIVEAANRRAEAEGIARDMIRRCREHGYRWSDMVVLLRDTETYAAVIERTLADYGIPFFSDRKRPAVHHPLAEFLRSLFEIYLENWSYEPVFRCLKTGLLPISMDDIERLENYVLEFGIRGSRWTKEEPWRFTRRLSLSEDSELNDGENQALDRINAIRRRAVAPLVKMAERLADAQTAADITGRLFELLQELNVTATLEAWAEEAECAGDLEEAREHRQVWAGLMDLFDQLVEACGSQPITLEDYSLALNEGLEGLQLSIIPPGLDHVAVSSLERTRIDNVRAVYIPGVNDGVFPMKARSEGVLTGDDRSKLREWGLELAPSAKEDVFAEAFLVYTAVTRASDYLWMSYPLADEEGKALLPSLEIAKIRKLAGIKAIRSLAVDPPDGEERSYLAHPRRSLSPLAVSLRRYKNGEEISNDWWDVYNWLQARPELKQHLKLALAGLFHHNAGDRLPPELAKRLYCRQKRLRGSVTRFESYRACPFKHFVQYGLGLKERPVFRLQAPDLGQFLHAVLKEFGDQLAAEGRHWGSLTDEESRRLCGRIVEQLAPKLQNEILLSSEQYKHMLKRLRRRVERSVARLVEFDRATCFKPIALEAAFSGDGAALPALVYPLDDDELEIVGQIDRLDIVRHNGSNYLLVLDYKSGQAHLSLPEVYYGLRLQLLTYLLAALKAGRQLFPGETVQPAGMLYYFLKNPSVAGNSPKNADEIMSEINRQLKMPGWILKEPEIVRLLDANINGWSEFIKVGFGKKQDFVSTCLAQLKSREEFDRLLGHAERIFLATARAILAGDVSIRPYWFNRMTPCGYCPYRSVCQFDKLVPGNEYRVLDALSDDEIWAKLSGEGGEG
ncbi:MAG: helicase-exonuclease AddAB subunit AddB [Negativicutes bacterium]|nr:helicase-exonuclease AddAB subunit AddB [Negativicutes bacterium]